MTKINWLELFVFVIGSELLGSLGSIFTIPAISTWYANLNKPILTPPNWVFGPVWTTLFALMGIAAYLVFQKLNNKKSNKKQIKNALYFFGLQFIFNILWSFLFFGQKSMLLGLLDIIILWILILITMVKFYKVNKMAGYLLLPYLLWVTLASYLNFMVFLLNR